MGSCNTTILIVIFLPEEITSETFLLFYNYIFYMYIQIFTMYTHYVYLFFFLISYLDS